MTLRRLTSSCLVVLAMIATTLVAFGGTSSAAGAKPAGLIGFISNMGSLNGCLDLRSYTNGTPVTLALCASGVSSQQWDYEDAATLRNVGSGDGCLDLRSYTNGSPAVLAPCDQHSQSQKWVYIRTGGTIRNVGSVDGCLDLRSYLNGTPATLEHCSSTYSRSQNWEG